ncbi:MAG: response regulator [Halobacteriales archaeon]|nr:response regulator [Halobacteriales archaeon]
MPDGCPPTVLLVDDEQDILDLYATWLGDEYTVLTATSGTEALELVDNSVDVVLLDRRMPDLTGDEVLEAIRNQHLDCQVAMLTAVEPDFDVISMGFDDYLIKPVGAADLTDLIEHLLTRKSYTEHIQRFMQLTKKHAMLETRKTDAELTNNEDYQQLESELEAAREKADESLDQLPVDETNILFREIDREQRNDA